MREIDECGNRVIALNDADFFGTPRRAAELMQALKDRGVRWQAGANGSGASEERLLELAAESGCYMLSIGFESVSRATLRNVHKHQNNPEKFQALVEKIQSYRILVFGLFMFGFDKDDPSVFDETVEFNIEANYDMCAYSVLTPYPGTITWYEMEQERRIVSYDWDKYDQGSIVYRPRGLTPQQLRDGHMRAYQGSTPHPRCSGAFRSGARAAAASGPSTICSSATARSPAAIARMPSARRPPRRPPCRPRRCCRRRRAGATWVASQAAPGRTVAPAPAGPGPLHL